QRAVVESHRVRFLWAYPQDYATWLKANAL
ncbi:MAG: hypothetical protein ACI87L_002279, partial [Litorivivens sp.]